MKTQYYDDKVVFSFYILAHLCSLQLQLSTSPEDK